MEEVIKRDIEFIVATGRSILSIKELTWLWNAPIYIIAMNGAIILDKERNVIYSNKIDPKYLQQIYKDFSVLGLEFFSKEIVYCNLDKNSYIERYSKWDMWKKKILDHHEKNYLEKFLGKYSFDTNISDILNVEIYKVNGLNINYEDYAKQKMEHLSENLVNAPFCDSVFEITNKNVSKRTALDYLVKNKKWCEDNVHVFGDGGNDIDMLQGYKNSYSPNSAPDAIKNVAKNIVGSVEKYGVIHEIERIVKMSND